MFNSLTTVNEGGTTKAIKIICFIFAILSFIIISVVEIYTSIKTKKPLTSAYMAFAGSFLASLIAIVTAAYSHDKQLAYNNGVSGSGKDLVK